MPHVTVGACGLCMFHRGLVLTMLLVMGRLQMMMCSCLVLRCRLKVVVVLTAVIGRWLTESLAHIVLRMERALRVAAKVPARLPSRVCYDGIATTGPHQDFP